MTVTNSSGRFRREDDRRIERVLTLCERIDERQGHMETLVQAIADGSKQLPQCREHDRRLDGVEKKISEHSYNELNQRMKIAEKAISEYSHDDLNSKMNVLTSKVNILEDKLKDLLENIKWYKRAVIGAVITTAAFAVRSLLF